MFSKSLRTIVLGATIFVVAVTLFLGLTPVASAQAPVDPCTVAAPTQADVVACQKLILERLSAMEKLLQLIGVKLGVTTTITGTNPVTSTGSVTTTAPITVPKAVQPNPDCGGGLPAFTIPAGQVKLVKSGCRVSGDVEIGTAADGPRDRLYDDDANTGVVVSMLADGYVYAPYGASVNNDTSETWVNNMMQSGCLGHCLVVYPITWPTQ